MKPKKFFTPILNVIEPKKDRLLSLKKVIQMTGASDYILRVLFDTGLINGEYYHRPLIYESEIAKIKDLIDKGFQEDNIIYGAKKLGELLEEFSGKKSWGNEFAEIIKRTTPDVILGTAKVEIYKRFVEVPIFSKKDISVERIKNFVNGKIAKIQKKKIKIIRSQNGN